MTGITKREASILWGNGFKLKDKEGNVYDILSCGEGYIEAVIKVNSRTYRKFITLKEIGTDYHIICHSIEKLTQTIMHEGNARTGISLLLKRFSLLDLSECVFEVWGDFNNCFANAVHNGNVIDAITFDGTVFDTMKNGGDFYSYKPQTELWSYLDTLHFDYLGWRERGLTADKLNTK